MYEKIDRSRKMVTSLLGTREVSRLQPRSHHHDASHRSLDQALVAFQVDVVKEKFELWASEDQILFLSATNSCIFYQLRRHYGVQAKGLQGPSIKDFKGLVEQALVLDKGARTGPLSGQFLEEGLKVKERSNAMGKLRCFYAIL